MSAPRTAAVPVRFLGRVVAGLGEVQRILMVERDDLEHTRDRVAQIAHTQSHLGLLLTDQVATIDFYDEPSVQMPPPSCCALHAPSRLRPTWWRLA